MSAPPRTAPNLRPTRRNGWTCEPAPERREYQSLLGTVQERGERCDTCRARLIYAVQLGALLCLHCD